ncbi:MAG: HD domain-containing protein [Steroidobacteraceae bacterium]
MRDLRNRSWGSIAALLLASWACAMPLALAAQTRGPSPGAIAAIAPASSWREAVQQFAKMHEKNPAWGYSHSVRDYELARSLAAADHVKLDDDILFAAAYLHDIGAFAPYARRGMDHSDAGADIVGQLLAGTGFPMSKVRAVAAAIRTHMYYRQPVGPEAIYLHDADALDWLGAIGAARIFGLVDPNGGQPDGPAAVKRLQNLLAKVPPGVVSSAGKAQLARRVPELHRFLGELAAESRDYRTL